MVAVQSNNVAAVNKVLNGIYVEDEDYDRLRESIDLHDNFDQIGLAQKIEKHELLEMRRLAAYIYKKAGRWKQSIALSKKDNLYKDAMETASQSGERELAEELLVYFIEKGKKECFASCLFVCYDLIQADIALELAWMNNMIDFAFPYLLQFICEYTGKVDELVKDKIEALNEVKAKEKEEKDVMAQQWREGGVIISAYPMNLLKVTGVDIIRDGNELVKSYRTKRVYPPCDTSGLQVLPLERPSKTPMIISVAQFRPEKAHTLQLEAFSVALKKLDADLPRSKLQFLGSCRNKSDEERVQNLKNKAIDLKVDGDVEFYKNLMYRDLMRLLAGATAGIHSMTDEHFGISVVEYMAAAHNSAGPKMDIVLEEDGQQTGLLASSVEEYADAILNIIRMPETERLKMAAAARRRAGRFSEQRFYQDFKDAIQPILNHGS